MPKQQTERGKTIRGEQRSKGQHFRHFQISIQISILNQGYFFEYLSRCRRSRLYRGNPGLLGPRAWSHPREEHPATWSSSQRWPVAAWRSHPGGKADLLEHLCWWNQIITLTGRSEKLQHVFSFFPNFNVVFTF